MRKAGGYYHWDGDELVLICRVTPRSGRDAFRPDPVTGLKIAITAPPVDGKANEHLIKFLADRFDTPRSSIRIIRGQNSRQKTIGILHPTRLPDELQIEKS